MIGTQELIIILVIVLILFGASRLPALARGLGESIREFRKATSEDRPADDATQQDSTDTQES